MENYLSEKQIKNLEFFKSNIDEFLKNKLFENKFLVVYDQEIKNSFDTFENALDFALRNFPTGEFIIQQVIDYKKIINFIRSAV